MCSQEENDSAETRKTFTRESMRCKKWNGMLYGRLLMAVANGSLGYESPVVSTVLVHSPVHPETEGNGYLAFQALKTTYEADTNFKPWEFGQRLRYARMRPEDILDPARRIQELKSM